MKKLDWLYLRMAAAILRRLEALTIAEIDALWHRWHAWACRAAR
jgi:hypothetical protein